MASYNNKVQTIWNMDDARLKDLDYYFTISNQALFNYDVETAYRGLLGCIRILSSKANDNDFAEINNIIEEIQEMKNDIKDGKEESKDDYFRLVHELFIEVHRVGQSYGLYLRVSDDPSRAVLKR